ncbi:phosphatase PAP2 family protein [Melioribacter sp. OK-6-Me]|uniref:phosphatase PAP2 family protein n=1 Tax=unclassified Melioribacter TaxID=2627329 RepID=UPI003ED968B1
MKIIRNSFFFLFLSVHILFSQNANPYNLDQFAKETTDFIKVPFNANKNDFLILGIISAGTYLSMQIDQPVRDVVLKNQKYHSSLPMKFGKMWGELYMAPAIALLTGLYGNLSGNKTYSKIGFEIAQTILYSGMITGFIKIAAGRARPFTDKGSSFYKPFTFFNDDYHSLPSGHATLAFGLSTVLSNNTESDYLKILFYLPAILTTISRVYHDNHWTSDVLLGAAVGYFTARWIYNKHHNYNSNTKIGLMQDEQFNWIYIKINF